MVKAIIVLAAISANAMGAQIKNSCIGKGNIVSVNKVTPGVPFD